MPRPTAAQLAYGSATVIFSTLAMLLLSQTRSVVGVAVVALAALGLGLLVAMTAPAPRRGTGRARTVRAPESRPLDARIPTLRMRAEPRQPMGEHSLRR
jgi:hypothetical protein